ncbi:MAG: helix-turn-helix transcriptional regulator [Chloroflexi bacterium]|nr:helix-turn-helix transcriptional regulator [Chloroflexota bacterium]
MITVLPTAKPPGPAPANDLSKSPSFVMHERGRQHDWEGVGLLSLKSFVQGEAWYRAGGGHYRLDHRSYLILNHAQPYSIEIEAEREVESFCLFFEEGFAEQVFQSLTANNDRLLSGPDRRPAAFENQAMLFFERTYPHDDTLTPLLTNLRLALASQPQPDLLWLQEQFHRVMAGMLRVHQAVAGEVETLTATRAATRQELYRRLYRVKDYLDACYNQPVDLEELAAIGAFSPNHLLRTFKQLFHLTPHQYLIARRLDQAGQLLRETELPVTEVCLAVGFESLGSFSWLFHRKTGLSPQSYRQANR